MSRTFAILDVSPAVYEEIQALLVAAGYQCLLDVDGEVLIDMHGIALRSGKESS